ncbi:MAG: hypothetical protein AAGG53_07085 [Cyanobacteria bacterium P01_H01_bin.152]
MPQSPIEIQSPLRLQSPVAVKGPEGGDHTAFIIVAIAMFLLGRWLR